MTQSASTISNLGVVPVAIIGRVKNVDKSVNWDLRDGSVPMITHLLWILCKLPWILVLLSVAEGSHNLGSFYFHAFCTKSTHLELQMPLKNLGALEQVCWQSRFFHAQSIVLTGTIIDVFEMEVVLLILNVFEQISF